MYNVAPYIERCIHSLENQNISKDDYEIICINDGSPDNCRVIIEGMQMEYRNIILINQDNQGVSRARNNGIDNASGTYVLLVDPDDYVDANCFDSVLNNADKHQAQVSFLGFAILNEDSTVHKLVLNENHTSQIYTGTEAYFKARGDGRNDPDRMWAILFEKDFLNKHNLRFLPDVPYLEDGEFISRILCIAERCIFDGHSFYQRTTRRGSATNSNLFHSEKSTNGFLLAASNLMRFQKERNLTENQRNFLNQPICKFAVLAITSAGKPFSFIRMEEIKKRLSGKGLTKLRLDSVNEEFRKLGFIYNRSIYGLVLYQFFISKFRVLFLRINIISNRLKYSCKKLLITK